jgi:hypothetical protein
MSHANRSNRVSAHLTRREVIATSGALAAGGSLAAHGWRTSAALAASQVEGDLLMWTFFDQVEIAAKRFMAANSGVNMTVEVFPGDQYETKMHLTCSTPTSGIRASTSTGRSWRTSRRWAPRT